MAHPFRFATLAGALLLAGCQAVNTTSGGAVGVDRKQYMFSMLSSQEVDQMYAQSYQKTLGEAKAPACSIPAVPTRGESRRSPSG